MSRQTVNLTSAARTDIEDIADYIAADNPVAAAKFGEEVVAAIARLTASPNTGTRYESSPDIRWMRVSVRFGKYLIYHRRIDSKTTEIVRVLHGARDIAAILRGK